MSNTFPLFFMNRANRDTKDTIISCIILALFLIIVFKEVVFSDYIFVKRDIARYYYPLRNFVSETFRRGQIPLWNPYIFCGVPVHAPIQNCVFYPLSLIYYFMGAAKGLSIFIIVHLYLSAVFMYLFARDQGVSGQGSFLAAFSFCFSGYLMGVICLVIALASVTWFPLIMMVFLRNLKEYSYRRSLYLGILLTLMFLGGDPNITIATLFIIVATSAYLFIETLVKHGKKDYSILKSLLIALSVFLLLSAFQILPAIEFYHMTIRTEMAWEEASAWSIPYSHLFSFIIPYFNEISFFQKGLWSGQKWLENYYIGIITIILACIALYYGRKNRRLQYLFIIAVISMAVSLGRHFILYPLAYKIIPLVRLLRYPVRFFFIFTFSASALAGMGLDFLKERLNAKKVIFPVRPFLTAAFISSIFVVITWLLYDGISSIAIRGADKFLQKRAYFGANYFPSLIYADVFNLRRSLLYISGFGLFIFLWARTRYKRFMPLLILFLAVSDILFTNTGFEETEKTSYFKEAPENVRAVMGDKDIFRIFASPHAYNRFTWLRGESYHSAIKTSKELFANNRMMEFGLYDPWGYDSASLKRNNDIIKLIYLSKRPDNTRLLELLNVKYLSASPDMNTSGYKKFYKTKTSTIYLNSHWLPRAFLVRKAVYIKGDRDILKYMVSKKFNPRREIVLESNLKLPPSPPLSDGNINHDKAEIIKYTPGEIELAASAKAPAFLFLSDTYYPGWKAYVDAKAVPIHRADYFLRAIVIPSGNHTVRFVYKPFSFRMGSAISILSMLVLFLYLISERLRLTAI